MTSLVAALCTVGALLIGALAGYVVRLLVEKRQDAARERAVRALGGQLPDWEHRARELETQAHEEAAYRRNFYKARELREEADVTRKRGRQRDQEWR